MNMRTAGKPRLSWVDWLLIGLVLLGILAGLFAFRNRFQKSKEANVTLVYRVYIPNLEDPFAKNAMETIKEGTTVSSQNGTAVLGQVISVEAKPHKEAVLRNTKMVMVDVPGRIDLYILVRGEGQDCGREGLRICDIRIAAGGSYSLRFDAFYAAYAKVLSVETTEVAL